MNTNALLQHGVCSLRSFRRFVLLCALSLFFVFDVAAQAGARLTTVSLVELGSSSLARTAGDRLLQTLKSSGDVLVSDMDLTRAAAKGSGYSGSLNMTLAEARNLGAALGTDFYLVGDAQVLRRSSSSQPVFYEAYCSMFLISARSGRLATWYRPSVQSLTSEDAEKALISELSKPGLMNRLLVAIRQTEATERTERATMFDNVPVIEDAPDDDKVAEAQGLRLPKPFRRLRPEYPQSAATADAEATVDVLVNVGTDGKVGQVEVVRWAGFGLDEVTVATVRQLHFFPAMRNGTAVPLRVLLRYNFRKPATP